MTDKYAFIKSCVMPYSFDKTYPMLPFALSNRLAYVLAPKTENIILEAGAKVEMLIITQSIVATNNSSSRPISIYVKKAPTGSTLAARYGTQNSSYVEPGRKIALYSCSVKLNINTAELSYKAYLYDKAPTDSVIAPDSMTPLVSGKMATGKSLYLNLIPETWYSNTPYLTKDTPYTSQHLLVEFTNNSTSDVTLTHVQTAYGETSLPQSTATAFPIVPHIPIEFSQYIFRELRWKYAVINATAAELQTISNQLTMDIKSAITIIATNWRNIVISPSNSKLINFMLFYLDYFIMSNKFDYIKFALMPYQAPSAVSPYTPVGLNKVMRKMTFSATGVSIPASGVLEGVIAEPLVGSVYSPIGLFYSASLSGGTNLTSVYGTAKTLSNVPLLNSGLRYVGGYLKITPYTGMYVTYQTRYYEANPNSSTAHNWSVVADSGESAIKTSSNVVNTPLYIGMAPNDLRYKNIEGITYPYFPYAHHHFRVNNVSNGAMTVDIMGEWWVETYEPFAQITPYIQDTKCPYKLAEYILSKLKPFYSHILESERVAKWNVLDLSIQGVIDTIVTPWAVLTSDITIASDNNSAPVDDNADWNSRKLIWNP